MFLHNVKDVFFIPKWGWFEPIMCCEVPGTEKFVELKQASITADVRVFKQAVFCIQNVYIFAFLMQKATSSELQMEPITEAVQNSMKLKSCV